MPVLPEWNAFINVTEATLAEALMPPGDIMGLRPWTAVTCIMFAMVSCVVFMCFCVPARSTLKLSPTTRQLSSAPQSRRRVLDTRLRRQRPRGLDPRFQPR
ncbi:hypothetical protein EHS25_008365 [Saitozyma podzolica]|uniref:Uncharacterized protein n=1 Tax=Saitozyma podzolica TaxID=1890683 RepID=A0A427YPC1_9TREE|nr:hypothetical protein EHS25_008365 [Saitozyma podzolica]